jgi:V-type H+-transporting ATPase subunit H
MKKGKKGKKLDYEDLEKVVEEEQQESVGVDLANDTVLRRVINWEAMRSAKLINDNDLAMIKKFDKKPAEEREGVLDEEGVAFAELFLNFLANISQIEGVQYTLAIIDEILRDPARIPLFVELNSQDESLPFAPLLKLLTRTNADLFVYEKASKIAALLMTKCPLVADKDVTFFCRWISEQLKKPELPDIIIGITALQILLRRDSMREVFNSEVGIRLLAKVLDDHAEKRQVVYYVLYCLWLLSFNPEIAATFSSVNGLIPKIVEIMRKEEREKLRRISIAVLRNLLDKGSNNEQMLKAGALKVVTVLGQKRWGDQDIEEDLRLLTETLDKDMVLLNSFEAYKSEVLSGNLTWSPVHRSERFWRDNIGQFEENNFKVLAVLLELLKSSTNPTVLAVACYDLGEFVRFHPRGRRVLSKLGGKEAVMTLMSHTDEEVQKQALLAIQKMMVHNWEYLSKAS